MRARELSARSPMPVGEAKRSTILAAGLIITLHPPNYRYQENTFLYHYLLARYESITQMCTRSDSTRILKMTVSIMLIVNVAI